MITVKTRRVPRHDCWFAWAPSEGPPDLKGRGANRHGYSITGWGKTPEKADVDFQDRWNDWNDEPDGDW